MRSTLPFLLFFSFCFCGQTCAFITCSAVVPWAQGSPVFQGCVAVQNEETLLLKAPKESQNMRTAERGITQSMHKFSFSKVGESSLCIISINLYLLWTCIKLGQRNSSFLILHRSLGQRPHSNSCMSLQWRGWSKTCFKEKTGSSTLTVSPILERLILFRVRPFFPLL